MIKRLTEGHDPDEMKFTFNDTVKEHGCCVSSDPESFYKPDP